MKKLFTLCFACLLCVALSGCQKQADNKTSEVTNATEALTSVWESYADDEKFPSFGGDPAQPVENAPGSFDVSNVEGLASILIVPSDSVEQIDDAASLIHAMNANTFTAGAFHVKEADMVEDFVETFKTAILNNQWLCGFPETLLMFQLDGNYVVSVFGNKELIDNFQAKLTSKYPSAKLVVEEAF